MPSPLAVTPSALPSLGSLVSGPLAAPFLVGALALLVFALDLVLRDLAWRRSGPITCVGLLAILVFTWKMRAGEVAGGAFVLDAFAWYMQRILLAAGVLGTLGSIHYTGRTLRGREGEYYFLMLASLLGMLFLASVRELVLLVVALELTSIPLYVLAAMQKTSRPGVEGSIKLYLTGAVSSVITLYGLSFILGATETTRIADLARAPQSPLLTLGILLTLAGMGFKVGAVPFHMWIPDTYQGAPTPFVAFLSVAPKSAGMAALVRLFVEGFGAMRSTWWPLLFVVCAATMLVGNFLAIPQTNVKRMLGYSGISHVGLLLLALGITTPRGLGVLLFYLAAYVFTNMGAFFVAEVVGRQGNDELSAYRGLARRSPALGLAMLLFLLSLAGIPFVAGFWAKLLLFWAAWEAGIRWLVFLGAVLAVLALFYYLRVARSIYLEKPEVEGPVPVGWGSAWAIALAVAGVVGMGLRPAPFLDAAIVAAKSIMGVGG